MLGQHATSDEHHFSDTWAGPENPKNLFPGEFCKGDSPTSWA